MTTLFLKAFSCWPLLAYCGLFVLVFAVEPVLAQPLRFAIVGDFGDAPQNALDQGTQQVADLALGNTALVPGWTAPNLVVTVGDNNYGNASQWNTHVGAFYGSYIEDPTPATPDERTSGVGNNRFFPTIGNHDWDTGIASYENYFTFPTSSSGNSRYYDFTSGPVHFFMIDSDGREPDDGNDGGTPASAAIAAASTQGQWLQNGLAASTSPWNLVFVHHPPFSSGASHGDTPYMQLPYETWGADAVFAGHDHDYERLAVGGLPYIVTGNGGHDMDAFSSIPTAGSQVRYNGDYGATLVEADNSVLSIRHFNRSGQLIDTFNLGQSNPMPIAAKFQQGLASYAGAVDTFLQQASPTANNGTATSLNVDQVEVSSNSNSTVQALLRFNDVFGNGPGQVPLNAIVVSATLEFRTTNASTNPPGGATLHRLLQDWDTTSLNATWAGWGDGSGADNSIGGVQLDGVEALAAIEARVHTPETGRTIFDITGSLLAWQLNPAENFGWVLLPNTTDGWDFDSSNASGGSTFRPTLTINYIEAVPEPGTWLLLILGGMGFGYRTLRKRGI